MPAHILPLYVVCDQSYSMADHMDALNGRLVELLRALRADPALAASVRFGLIGFSETARIVVPLAVAGEGAGQPVATTGAESNFAAAFTLLRHTIQRDVDSLVAASYVVGRPVVCFVSDGQPTDPAMWPSAHAELVDRDWPVRPRLVAVGLGEVDRTTIGRIGTHRAYPGGTETGLWEAVREFAGDFGAPSQDAGPNRRLPRLRHRRVGCTTLERDPR